MNMLTVTLRKIRSQWTFFALLLVLSSLLNIVAPPTQVSAALSDAEKKSCFDKFNAKDIIRSELSIADQTLYDKCRSEGWCFDAGEGGDIGSRRITCSNPIITSGSNSAADAEVAPLVTLVCGSVPSSEVLYASYIACGANVRKIYASCDMTGGSITSTTQDTKENTAKCVRDKLADPKPTIAQVLAAVTSGRNAAQTIIDKAIEESGTAREKQDCIDSGGEWVNNACVAAEEEKETCAIDGVGWLICPLAGFLGKVNDGAYAVVQKMLIFEIPNPFSTDPKQNAIYGVWSTLRNVANILFVIAFFAVIFSQATSVGISAYGIRKMLPRIVVAAILVNLSYYICVFAIDISNIIGGGFTSLIGAANPEAMEENGAWEKAGSAIMAGGFFVATGVAAAGIAVFFTGFFLALAATAFLAIFFTLVILLVRHALLILLIVLSPLAFVAYILPNTESIFDKWRKTFISLLVMYPLIALLFAGTKLASNILFATHQGAADTGGWVSWLYLLMALGVLTIPLFGIPWIVKFSGGALARFSGAMNNSSKGLVDRARKYGEEGAKSRRARGRAYWADNKYMKNAGYKMGNDGKPIFDSEGNRVKESGARNRLRRGVGATADWSRRAARGDRARNLAQQEQMANERMTQSWAEEAGEEHTFTDSKGKSVTVSTDRSRRLVEGGAAKGAGPGGAARVRAAAVAAQKKEHNDQVEREITRIKSTEHNSSEHALAIYSQTGDANNEVTQEAIARILASGTHGAAGKKVLAEMLRNKEMRISDGKVTFEPTADKAKGVLGRAPGAARGLVEGAGSDTAFIMSHPDVGYSLNDVKYVEKMLSGSGGNPDVSQFGWGPAIASSSAKVLKASGQHALNIEATTEFTPEVAQAALADKAGFANADAPIQAAIRRRAAQTSDQYKVEVQKLQQQLQQDVTMQTYVANGNVPTADDSSFSETRTARQASSTGGSPSQQQSTSSPVFNVYTDTNRTDPTFITNVVNNSVGGYDKLHSDDLASLRTSLNNLATRTPEQDEVLTNIMNEQIRRTPPSDDTSGTS